MAALLTAVPLKGFDDAKGRLAGRLAAQARSQLARATAERVVDAAQRAGFDVVVVTASDQVAQWAAALGVRVLRDPPGGGLDAAARLVATAASPWCLVHGDLPLIAPADLIDLPRLLSAGHAVVAPSRDGGTNLIAAPSPVDFSFGPGSFARHLAAASHLDPVVVVTPGLTVELDTIADLHAAARLRDGAWLTAFLS